MRGRIIVIEGTDCSGKETQSNLLEKRLKEQGKKFVVKLARVWIPWMIDPKLDLLATN